MHGLSNLKRHLSKKKSCVPWFRDLTLHWWRYGIHTWLTDCLMGPCCSSFNFLCYWFFSVPCVQYCLCLWIVHSFLIVPSGFSNVHCVNWRIKEVIDHAYGTSIFWIALFMKMFKKKIPMWMKNPFLYTYTMRGCCVLDRVVIRFTTIFANSVYHRLSGEFEFRSWKGVLHTTLWDKVCQRLATGPWFSHILRFLY